jgi:hypothetical protein
MHAERYPQYRLLNLCMFHITDRCIRSTLLWWTEKDGEVRGLSKKYPTLFFPTVSNGERVGKLSVVVEATFMRMCDFLLPLTTAGCVCRFQIVKWCDTCSSHSRFAQDDRMLGTALLHQVLSQTWGYPCSN